MNLKLTNKELKVLLIGFLLGVIFTLLLVNLTSNEDRYTQIDQSEMIEFDLEEIESSESGDPIDAEDTKSF